MLTRITTLPQDKPIAGVHVVPYTEDGHIVMGWNRKDCLLETVGGRIEAGETHEDALRREAREEAGLELEGPFVPFAAWYWNSTDTYTVWYVARVAGFGEVLPGFETSGRVVFTVETARGIVGSLAHDASREIRRQILAWAQEVHDGHGK